MNRVVVACCALLLTVFAFAWAGAAPTSCNLCDEAAIVCARCDGKGTRDADCRRCNGAGQSSCIYCAGAGNWDCPICVDGMVRWDSGKTDRCKFCRGGTVKCTNCKGSRKVACFECKRARKVKQACFACFGVGRFACPTCVTSPCATCQGKKRIPCTQCTEGEQREACKKCLDSGKAFCGKCLGGVIPCRNCHATGKVRYVFTDGTNAGNDKCTPCKAKGSYRCPNCKSGLVDCSEKPKGKDCKFCSDGHRACPSCG
jgi:hypothetical protein